MTHPAPLTRWNSQTFYAAMAVCSLGIGLLYAQSKPVPAKPAAPENYAASKEWPTYGHDAGGMRHSPLAEISQANVSQLEIAWTYHLKPEDWVSPAGGRGRGNATSLQGSQATPLIINGIMY